MNNTRKVAVVGNSRIPFTRRNSAYVEIGNREMLEATLNGLIEKYKLQGELLGEVAGGAVIKKSSEGELVRESVMNTKLNQATPGCDLQQACDTGIEAAIYIANKIALGQIDSGIACGVDSTSQVPIVISEHLRKSLLKIQRSKTVLAKIKTMAGIKLKDFRPVVPTIDEPKTGLAMGGHTEYTAKYYKYPARIRMLLLCRATRKWPKLMMKASSMI